MRILLTNPTCLLDEILEGESHLNRYVGWLNTPKYFGNFQRYTDYDPSMPIAIDNCAYSGFKSNRYQALINKIDVPIEWIAAPDVVGDAETTSILFKYWYPELEGLPLAYVAQDGAERLSLPWSQFRCLFIGGTTEWKLSPAAAYLARKAKRFGKLVHMGRVNSDMRLRYAYDLGCDSVDGTGYQRFSKYHLKKALHFMHGLHNQLTLIGERVI
ncbi:MAG: hypothetical protein OXI63_11625 [Candidatus Poribacteria bacterium]|nr:hypothetical protein [Candidatus Poribacteria bacterium]